MVQAESISLHEHPLNEYISLCYKWLDCLLMLLVGRFGMLLVV